MDGTELYTIALSERSRLVLPARLRRRIDLHPVDRLTGTVDPEGGIRIVSAREQARRLRRLYRDLAPGRSPDDAPVAEASLRVAPRAQALSVGLRACVATGLRLDRPVVTAYWSWSSLDV